MSPHELAVLFHSTYERLAPTFGWCTKKGCNVPFDQLPQRNKALMIATCQTVLNALQKKSSNAMPLVVVANMPSNRRASTRYK